MIFQRLRRSDAAKSIRRATSWKSVESGLVSVLQKHTLCLSKETIKKERFSVLCVRDDFI